MTICLFIRKKKDFSEESWESLSPVDGEDKTLEPESLAVWEGLI
jgi:hypothetical protein